MKRFVITKKELIKVAGYKTKKFPKYTASIINLLNRWARGTAEALHIKWWLHIKSVLDRDILIMYMGPKTFAH